MYKPVNTVLVDKVPETVTQLLLLPVHLQTGLTGCKETKHNVELISKHKDLRYLSS